MSTLDVGFTGTRNGMTDEQNRNLQWWLNSGLYNGEHPNELWFHHGDCVGADAEADAIAQALLYRTCAHPPINNEFRAYTNAHRIRGAEDYLIRNIHIVDESSVLIAAPKQRSEQKRSGTWYTYRYAKKIGLRTIVIWPDGSWEDSDA